jgi:small subunit ribosomal protein S8e
MARKISGGKYKDSRKSKKYEILNPPRLVKLGETRKRKLKTRGGEGKVVLLSTNQANVLDSKTKKLKVAKIKAVLEIPSNRYLKNILMKGTVIDTELGKAKITNRPGQEGAVEAVLIQ